MIISCCTCARTVMFFCNVLSKLMIWLKTFSTFGTIRFTRDVDGRLIVLGDYQFPDEPNGRIILFGRWESCCNNYKYFWYPASGLSSGWRPCHPSGNWGIAQICSTVTSFLRWLCRSPCRYKSWLGSIITRIPVYNWGWQSWVMDILRIANLRIVN